MSVSNPGRDGPRWFALGNARIVDWSYLERPKAKEGETAWVSEVREETVLLRAGLTGDGSKILEFNFMSRKDLTGSVVFTPSRPEPARLRVKTVLDIEGKLGYIEMLEFVQHPRSGLFGLVDRGFELTEGWIAHGSLSALPANEAVALAESPSRAILPGCGAWLHRLLEVVVGAVTLEASLEQTQRPPARSSAERAAPLLSVAGTAESPPAEIDAGLKPRISLGAPPTLSIERKPPPDVRRIMLSTNSGETWSINGNKTYIGRSKQCSIILKSQRVSRRHASVTMERDGFYLNDLGAANGIWAGSTKIERERIEHGAEYVIGDVLVTFTYPGRQPARLVAGVVSGPHRLQGFT